MPDEDREFRHGRRLPPHALGALDRDLEVTRLQRQVIDLTAELATWRLAARGYQRHAAELYRTLLAIVRDETAAAARLQAAIERVTAEAERLAATHPTEAGGRDHPR